MADNLAECDEPGMGHGDKGLDGEFSFNPGGEPGIKGSPGRREKILSHAGNLKPKIID